MGLRGGAGIRLRDAFPGRAWRVGASESHAHTAGSRACLVHADARQNGQASMCSRLLRPSARAPTRSQGRASMRLALGHRLRDAQQRGLRQLYVCCHEHIQHQCHHAGWRAIQASPPCGHAAQQWRATGTLPGASSQVATPGQGGAGGGGRARQSPSPNAISRCQVARSRTQRCRTPLLCLPRRATKTAAVAACWLSRASTSPGTCAAPRLGLRCCCNGCFGATLTRIAPVHTAACPALGNPALMHIPSRQYPGATHHPTRRQGGGGLCS